MFGLEGSGFTICLGVILLLTGIVMYYCKSKITQNEHKINSMFNLVSALHEEVNLLKSMQNPNTMSGGDHHDFMQEHEHRPHVEEVEHRVREESDDDSENESESENEEVEPSVMPTSFLNHPYEELIPKNLDSSINQSEDSQSETDNDEEVNNEGNIKVVDLGEIEELTVEPQSSEDESGTNGDDDDDDDEVEVEVQTIKEVQEVQQMDYTKMQVAALKKIVTERNLASNVSKLRKPELLSLLQAQ